MIKSVEIPEIVETRHGLMQLEPAFTSADGRVRTYAGTGLLIEADTEHYAPADLVGILAAVEAEGWRVESSDSHGDELVDSAGEPCVRVYFTHA